MEAAPRSLFSWNFDVMEETERVAEIDVSWFREKGELIVQGVTYEVYREGVLSGAFILKSCGEVLARAEKPSAFLRSFVIEHAGRRYTLEAEHAFARAFVLLDGFREVGSLRPGGFFKRRMRVDLPDDLPLAVRVFMIWLVVILWKRSSDAAAAS